MELPTPGVVHRADLTDQPREVTRLVMPPSLLTQKAPNQREISKEFNITSLPPRQSQPRTPASPGAAALPRQRFTAPRRPGAPAPAPVVPEAPAIDPTQLRASGPPAPALGIQTPLPAPQIEAAEKPKIAFERPGLDTGSPTATSRIPLPGRSVQDAVRKAAQSRGGIVVGDDDALPGAIAPKSPSTPLPGKLGSSVELLSDPMGTDFWPYLIRVLAAVRRNWYAVIPESARLGRRGNVIVQFAIAKDGSVAKVVFGQTSGAEALDRAAVAAISASNPFPPLPSDFRGQQIRLQFAFKYNSGPR
jgi:TonB family protein